jgi:hypothetical protein
MSYPTKEASQVIFLVKSVESIVSLVVFLDQISANVKAEVSINYFKFFQIFKTFNYFSLSSKFIDSYIFKNIMSLPEGKAENLYMISEMLESSITVDDKRTLIKKILPSIKVNDKFEFSHYLGKNRFHFLKILGISHRLVPDIINESINSEILTAIGFYLQSNYDSKNIIDVIMSLVYFNVKNITTEERESLNNHIKVIVFIKEVSCGQSSNKIRFEEDRRFSFRPRVQVNPKHISQRLHV